MAGELRYEPCGKSPIACHCHGCGHEWRVGWLPSTLDQLIGALTDVSCPRCKDGAVRLGPACSVAVERAETWERHYAG